MDRETANLATEQERTARFVQSDDWQLIKSRLIDKIMDLQSVMNVMDGTAESIVIDMKSRRMAVQVLYEILADIEGTAAQYESNAKLMAPDDDYLKVEN